MASLREVGREQSRRGERRGLIRKAVGGLASYLQPTGEAEAQLLRREERQATREGQIGKEQREEERGRIPIGEATRERILAGARKMGAGPAEIQALEGMNRQEFDRYVEVVNLQTGREAISSRERIAKGKGKEPAGFEELFQDAQIAAQRTTEAKHRQAAPAMPILKSAMTFVRTAMGSGLNPMATGKVLEDLQGLEGEALYDRAEQIVQDPAYWDVLATYGAEDQAQAKAILAGILQFGGRKRGVTRIVPGLGTRKGETTATGRVPRIKKDEAEK